MKRFLLMIPILLGVTLVVFTIMYFTPGSPGELLAGPNPDPVVIEQINHDLGFDQPYAVRYFNFLKGGSSMKPTELLKLCGLDMEGPGVVNAALDVFESLLGSLE